MTKMLRVAATLCAIGVLSLTGGVIAGCGGGSVNSGGVTRDALPKLIGQWQLVRTSGGITGGGYPVTPGAEIITFNQDGAFYRTRSGQANQGTYTITERRTMLSENVEPVIDYDPATMTEVISALDDQSLTLSEEAADGFVREYQRVIMTAQ